MDYTRLVEIALKGERASTRFHWELGDELASIIPAGMPTKLIGLQLSAACAALNAKGLNYRPNSLRQIRRVAMDFPHNTRHADIAWYVHRDARRPETLEAMLRTYPLPLTNANVQHYLRIRKVAEDRAIRAEKAARAERREEARSRKEAADKAARGAATPAVRRDAERRAAKAAQEMAENAVPPTLDDVWVPEPSDQEKPLLLAWIGLNAKVKGIKLDAESLEAAFAQFIASFTDDEREITLQDIEAAVQALQSFAAKVRKTAGKKRLSVVA